MAANVDSSYYLQKIKETEAKIKEAEKEAEKINTILNSMGEVNTQYNEQLSRMAVELDNYDRKIAQLNQIIKKKKGGDSDEGNELIDQDHSDDLPLIYASLKKILEQINKVLTEVPVLIKHEDKVDAFQQTTCKALMVIYIDANSQNRFFQNFRLEKNTSFTDLKLICMNLWNIDPKDVDDFELKYQENNQDFKGIKEEKLEIDGFVKQNLKKAVFLFSKKTTFIEQDKIKSYFDKKETNKKKTNIINETALKFFQKFVGNTSYIVQKVEKRELLKQGDDKNKKKTEKGFGWINIFYFFFYMIFLVLTIISLEYKIPMDKAYQLNQSILKNLSITHRYKNKLLTANGMTVQSILFDIGSKLQNFFLTDQGSLTDLMKTYTMASHLRISFHRTKNATPPSYVQDHQKVDPDNSPKDFFYARYNSLTENTTAMMFDRADFLSLFDESKTYFYNYSDSSFKYRVLTNKTELKLKIFDLATSVYKSDSVIVDPNNLFLIEGKIGIYTGNYYNIYLSPMHMNINTLNCLFTYLSQTELFNKGLRSIVISYTLMNYKTKFFYYISITYELNVSGFIYEPDVKVSVFLPNIYAGDYGSLLRICDIIRLIFVILLCLITLQQVLSGMKLSSVQGTMKLFLLILQPTVIINLSIIIIFLICYISKIKNLQFDLNNVIKFINKIDYIVITPDYINTYYYSLDIIYETILCFLLFARTLLIFWFFKKIKTFTSYILDSLGKMILFVILIVFVFIGFVVFANNLWGLYYPSFIDLSSSFQNILLFSIGHFQKDLVYNIFPNWTFVFMLFYYFLVVYFIMNSFVGIYLEAYRIVMLKQGNPEEKQESSKDNNYKLISSEGRVTLKTDM